MKLSRLSGRKVCERVKVKGVLWRGKHFFARYVIGLPRGLRDDAAAGIEVGTLTSVKLDKSAVKRNRMRRRCREALRVILRAQSSKLKAQSSSQLLLLPRSSSLSAPFGELLRDADSLFSHLSARARW